MTQEVEGKTPFLWGFIDDDLGDGVPVFAVVATPMDGEDLRNIAIKSRQGLEYFGVTMFKAGWQFAADQEVMVTACFGDDNKETMKATANGQMLDILLPIESAALFLSLVATSASMTISFPNGEDELWDVDLRFAEPFVRKMMIRLIQSAAIKPEAGK